MTIEVTQDFIDYRAEKAEQYNQRGRSDRKFLMDLDAEVLEYYMIKMNVWKPHESWMVDAVDSKGRNLDVKFIRKYWNVSREKTLNLIKQRNIIDYYAFYEWISRPRRPLAAGDSITIGLLGTLDYDFVADNLRKSFKEPDGFYVDVHSAIRPRGTPEGNTKRKNQWNQLNTCIS